MAEQAGHPQEVPLLYRRDFFLLALQGELSEEALACGNSCRYLTLYWRLGRGRWLTRDTDS